MKGLEKIEAKSIKELYVNVEDLNKKIKNNIEILLSKLPTDLKSLNIVEGDEFEEIAMNVYSKQDSKIKEFKDKRLQITRQFDAAKKQFINLENEANEENQKAKKWVEDYASEKLRREKIEDEKKEKERKAKEKEREIYNNAISHYFDLSLKSFNSLKQKTENAYFKAASEDELNDITNRLKNNLSEDKIRGAFQKARDLNSFEIEDAGKLLIIKEILPKVKENEEQYVQDYFELCKNLINFYPTQLEKIKNADEDKKKEEAKKLEQKQKEEAEELQKALDQKKKEQAQEKAIKDMGESLEAKPSIELRAGTSVKMKYYPKNHAELLKIVQWYVKNEYTDVDFDTLNKRLSFMRTAADKALNDFGELIEGVHYKEDVRVRKTSK